MSQKSSLMEWIEQTKKLSKEVDYITLDTIDSIVTSLPLTHPQIIRDHAEFFDYFCVRYHKPNPVNLIRKRYSMLKGLTCEKCSAKQSCKSILDKYVEASILRCERAQTMITWQWFEVIDFMFERPELVDANMIDGYVRQRIGEVCVNHKKNNPLKNGLVKRFGRYWKDEKGTWHKERRRRF